MKTKDTKLMKNAVAKTMAAKKPKQKTDISKNAEPKSTPDKMTFHEFARYCEVFFYLVSAYVASNYDKRRGQSLFWFLRTELEPKIVQFVKLTNSFPMTEWNWTDCNELINFHEVVVDIAAMCQADYTRINKLNYSRDTAMLLMIAESMEKANAAGRDDSFRSLGMALCRAADSFRKGFYDNNVHLKNQVQIFTDIETSIAA